MLKAQWNDNIAQLAKLAPKTVRRGNAVQMLKDIYCINNF